MVWRHTPPTGNRDDGDLVDIRRFYVQDGIVIPNSNVSIAGVHGDSITDKVCFSVSILRFRVGDLDFLNIDVNHWLLPKVLEATSLLWLRSLILKR